MDYLCKKLPILSSWELPSPWWPGSESRYTKPAESCPADAPVPEVAQYFATAVVAGRTRDTAFRVTSRAAQNGVPRSGQIIPLPHHQPRREELPKIKRPVEYIAANEVERPFEVQGDRI
jgi:hypothetical protein